MEHRHILYAWLDMVNPISIDYKIFPSREILNEGLVSEIPIGSWKIPDTVEYPYMGKMHLKALKNSDEDRHPRFPYHQG